MPSGSPTSLRGLAGVKRCEIAGSLRRFAETAKDVDLVAARPAAPALWPTRFVELDWVAQVEARGEPKVTCVAHDGTRVELRMVEPERTGTCFST